MFKVKYKIVKERGEFYIKKKTLFFGWRYVKEWLGCDTLGFDHGWDRIKFSSRKKAKKHIKKIEDV